MRRIRFQGFNSAFNVILDRSSLYKRYLELRADRQPLSHRLRIECGKAWGFSNDGGATCALSYMSRTTLKHAYYCATNIELIGTTMQRSCFICVINIEPTISACQSRLRVQDFYFQYIWHLQLHYWWSETNPVSTRLIAHSTNPTMSPNYITFSPLHSGSVYCLTIPSIQ